MSKEIMKINELDKIDIVFEEENIFKIVFTGGPCIFPLK
jgi:hypothetical protein